MNQDVSQRPTPRQHGPWMIVKSSEVYRDPWMTVVRDDVVRPDGKPGTYSVAYIKSGVSVLAVDDDNIVYLTEEFHYAVGRVTLECASGGTEPGEDALETAKRELKEELGITAAAWADMGVCDPFTATMLSPTRLFVARQLTFGETEPDGTEQIRCVKMPLAEAINKVIDSEISHAPSALLILKAARAIQQT